MTSQSAAADRKRIRVFVRVRPLLAHLGECTSFGSHGSARGATAGGGCCCVRCVSDTEIVVRGAHSMLLPPEDNDERSHQKPNGVMLGREELGDNYDVLFETVTVPAGPSLSSSQSRPRLSTLSPISSKRGGVASPRLGTPLTQKPPLLSGSRRTSSPLLPRAYSSSFLSSSSSSTQASTNNTLFQFDAVFDPHCTQSDVYEDTVLELLDKALQTSGTHASLLCYGPTGSGKTYSMVGDWDPTTDPTTTMGILPRTALQILSAIELHQRQATSTTTSPHRLGGGPIPVKLTVFAVELYVDELRDLLAHHSRRSSSTDNRRSRTPTKTGPSSSRVPSPSSKERGRSDVQGAVAVVVQNEQQKGRAPQKSSFLQRGVSFPSGLVLREEAGASISSAASSFSVGAGGGGGFTPSSPIQQRASSSTFAASSTTTVPFRDYANFDELCELLHGTEVSSLEGLRKLYAEISRTRVTSATASNDQSSRSHALFIMKIDFAEHSPPSFVALADLAGSERLKQSLAVGVGMLEAQSINKSLSALCSVVTALHQKSQHVPYRDAKLTRLLRPCLDGGWVAALVHVPPSDKQRDEALQTLKFAERMAHAQLRPTGSMSSRTTGESGVRTPTEATGGADCLDDAHQEALETHNERAQLHVQLLAAELRIANAAHGHLPRRLSTLPLSSLQARHPSWHSAWLRIKHAAETEAAEGAQLTKAIVERTMRAANSRIHALEEMLARESRTADALRLQLATDAHELDPSSGGPAAFVHEEKRRWSRLHREHMAALKVRLLVQHRLGLLHECEQRLKLRAQRMRTELLDESGAWQVLHRAVDASSEALQCETRNGLVVQGLFADQCEVLNELSALLEMKQRRRRMVDICGEAQRLGYGRLQIAGGERPTGEEKRAPPSTAPEGGNEWRREPVSPGDATEDVGSKRIDIFRPLSEDISIPQHDAANEVQMDEDDLLSIDWEDDDDDDHHHGVRLGCSEGQSSREENVEYRVTTTSTSPPINKAAVRSRNIFTHDDPPPTAALDRCSSSKERTNEPVDQIFVPLRASRVVDYVHTTMIRPSPSHWHPRPLTLGGPSSTGAACLLRPRPSLIGVYHDLRARRYVALRTLSMAAPRRLGIVAASSSSARSTVTISARIVYHHQLTSVDVTLRVAAHRRGSSTMLEKGEHPSASIRDSTRRLELVVQHHRDHEEGEGGLWEEVVGWVVIPNSYRGKEARCSAEGGCGHLQRCVRDERGENGAVVVVVVDEAAPRRHLLAVWVSSDSKSSPEGANSMASSSSCSSSWVLLEFRSATDMEICCMALLPLCGPSRNTIGGDDDGDSAVAPVMIAADLHITGLEDYVERHSRCRSTCSIPFMAPLAAFLNTMAAKQSQHHHNGGSAGDDEDDDDGDHSEGIRLLLLSDAAAATAAAITSIGGSIEASVLQNIHRYSSLSVNSRRANDGDAQTESCMTSSSCNSTASESADTLLRRIDAELKICRRPNLPVPMSLGDVRVLCNPQGLNIFVLGHVLFRLV